MGSNFIFTFTNDVHCSLESKLNFYLPFLFFIIGFCFFRFVVFKSNTNEKEEIRKRKISEYILNKYKEENEQFFFGTTESG